MFKCFICQLDCKTNAQLGEHNITVHGGGAKPFVCDGCGMAFSRKNNITKHKKTGACKGFQRIDELENGLAPPPYDCVKCGKTFKYKQSYTQHMEWIHLGQKVGRLKFLSARGRL